MFNSISEIKVPENRHLRYFLFQDYFHDSNILTIDFDRDLPGKRNGPRKVVLTIDCQRERERDSNFTYHNDKYVYLLTFEHCKYFHCEKTNLSNQFINSSFKDSPTLQRIKYATGKEYYHIRIQLGDGYMDIIFLKFKIRKLAGRIRVPFLGETDHNKSFLMSYGGGTLLGPDKELDEEKVCQLLDNLDDIDISFALEYFARRGKDVLRYAKKTVNFDWYEFQMSINAAIWVLGLQGGASELKLLQDIYLDVERIYASYNFCFGGAFLPKRNIMDAMERIKMRHGQLFNVIL